MQNTFHQGKSHNAVLVIRFRKECLVDYLWKVNSFFDKLSCDLHRFSGSAGILENTGIMHHSGVDTFCDLPVNALVWKQFKDQFTGGTCVWENIVMFCKVLIAHMMIHTDRMFCRFKILCSIAKTLCIPTVLCDKQIIFPVIRPLTQNLFRTLHKLENIRDRLQVKIDLHMWKIVFNIIVCSEAGACAVAIRSDMTCNGNCFCICQINIKICHLYSSVLSAISFVTSSIIFDILTPYSMDWSKIKVICGVFLRLMLFASMVLI